MSAKTFHRHVEASTGMTFGRWRQKLRLLVAVEALLGGASILRAALDSGYAAQSAFAAAFRRNFDITPSDFVAAAREHG
ncbi:helix-turn-helix domain-containing protein [Xylophilus sp.]|uniref:helix-turn-helix domain-containing protein n=1 Tax=Xylophilus sp. TaxID=2653893 RepID=UPI002D808A56|nr:helix-turn-helix domain-containing protein [Xylophilus sp.]